jgi:hypothetical protein
MTWNAFHRRGETLRTVIAVLDERRDGVLPWASPGVVEHFADEPDLVGALLLKWHARLSGNVERALAHEPRDLPGAVVSAWCTTAGQLPGVRRAVDRCAAEGLAETRRTLDRAREREWSRLALAAGLASAPGPDAVAAGRELEQHARHHLTTIPDPRRTKEETVSKHKAHQRDTTVHETSAPEEATEVHESHDAHEQANASLVDRIKAALAAA